MPTCATDYMGYDDEEREEVKTSLLYIERMTDKWAGNTAYGHWPQINGDPVGYARQPRTCSIPKRIIYICRGEFRTYELAGKYS